MPCEQGALTQKLLVFMAARATRSPRPLTNCLVSRPFGEVRSMRTQDSTLHPRFPPFERSCARRDLVGSRTNLDRARTGAGSGELNGGRIGAGSGELNGGRIGAGSGDFHACFARVGRALRKASLRWGARRWLSQSLWLSAKETEPTALPPIPPRIGSRPSHLEELRAKPEFSRAGGGDPVV